LLAAIIELGSGDSFESYLHRNLFKPAGLVHTSFAWETRRWLDGQVAQNLGGYEGRFRSADPRVQRDSWLRRGPGGVLSNVSDLHRWDRALVQGNILSPQSLALLFAPHTAAEVDSLSYGYGWRIQKTPRKTTLVWHSGWDEAFSAVYRRYVDEGVVVLFTSNLSVDLVPMREVVLRSGREGMIGDILFGQGAAAFPDTRDAPGSLLEKITGRYVLDSENAVIISADEDQVWAVLEGQGAIEALHPETSAKREALVERNRQAIGLAEKLRMTDAQKNDWPHRLDPYGFAGVGPKELLVEWQRLEAKFGRFLRVSALGTSLVGFPGRERPVTFLRFHFRTGKEDYRMLWFGDDELYLLNGAPAAFHKVLRWVGGLRFVHFDLPRGEWAEVMFEERSGRIVSLTAFKAERAVKARRVS
jgi:hypothetical protein